MRPSVFIVCEKNHVQTRLGGYKTFFLPNSKQMRSLTEPEVIILVLCLSQLSMTFIMLINVKMATIVGISTFISMITITSECLTANFGIQTVAKY